MFIYLPFWEYFTLKQQTLEGTIKVTNSKTKALDSATDSGFAPADAGGFRDDLECSMAGHVENAFISQVDKKNIIMGTI